MPPAPTLALVTAAPATILAVASIPDLQETMSVERTHIHRNTAPDSFVPISFTSVHCRSHTAIKRSNEWDMLDYLVGFLLASIRVNVPHVVTSEGRGEKRGTVMGAGFYGW
ncbi:hypothetical protein FRB93_012849 [Tulasnella sp. JGI-2019a]|nr:hypothetical protein FRB93_012849 [Tulasnella sp. JGI-2019a]